MLFRSVSQSRYSTRTNRIIREPIIKIGIINRRNPVFQGSSESTVNTVNVNLPKGMVLDLNFDKVQAKMLYDNLYDVETAQGIARLKTFLTNPENKDWIGGDRNMEALQAVMKNTVLAQKNSMPFENDPLSKAIDRVAGSVMMKSARMA